MHDLESITRFAKTLRHPDRLPQDAATLVLIDREATPPKILLGRRHAAHAFMPGKYVFPGGRVDPEDQRMPVATPLSPMVEKRLMTNVSEPSAERARAIALSAIRETFEETGLAIGLPKESDESVPAGPWQEFARVGLYPNLDALHFVARAITPPGFPRRFDARFFAADAHAIQARRDGVVHAGAELIDLKWLTISDALELDLPDITYLVLHELESRISAGLKHETPVPFFRMRNERFVREEI